MKELFIRKDGKTDYCSQSPDVIFGVDIGLCCKAHDYNYHIPSSDKELMYDIRTEFDKANKHFLGKIVSTIYYIFVVAYRKLMR